mmetsp:Transcript_49536/g.131413  ORF Transcript_49536/g.131413 Transcript_49536/m.131413 type:complete len:220 (+) Transcript_49536:483-1142(+)
MLVSESIQEDKSQPFHVCDSRTSQQLHQLLVVFLAILTASQFLLELRSFQQPLRLDDSGKFMDNGDVLRNIARHSPELGILIHKPLHVLNRLYFRSVLCGFLVFLNVLLDAHSQITEVREQIVSKELILRSRHHNLLQLRSHTLNFGQIDSVVFHDEQFMEHGLVCPLIQQRSHWIVSTIQEKYNWRIFPSLFALDCLEEALLFHDPLLQPIGNHTSQI